MAKIVFTWELGGGLGHLVRYRALVGLLCERLRPGGLLHLATDWENYAEHMWDVLDAEPRLRNRAGPRGTSPRPEWRRQTHFETRGLKLGHGVWDLLYDRT